MVINIMEFVESVEAYSICVVIFPEEMEEAYIAMELKLELILAATAEIPVESVESPDSMT
jgi:hypothetical protein